MSWKTAENEQGVVAHACNPSGDWVDHGSRPAEAKSQIPSQPKKS
jgi:hypothetical protein